MKKVVVFFLLFTASSFAASPYVPLERYQREYRLLERAKEIGLIRELDLTYRPLTEEDFARAIVEIYNNRKVDPSLAKRLFDELYPEFKPAVDSLLKSEDLNYIKPLNDLSLELYGLSGAQHYRIPYGEGFRLSEGLNGRFRFSSSAKWDGFVFYLEPEVRNTTVRLNRGYVLFEKKNIRISFGKASVVWGAPPNGGLLFTDNIRPWLMFKIENPEFEKFPWFLKPLGDWKISTFVSQLEKERPRSYAHVIGMRFTWRPFGIDSLELSASRAIQFGGSGRPNYHSLHDYWNVFIAKQENEPGSRYDNNQLMSYEVVYYLNWLNRYKFQPFKGGKFYFVYGGDDAVKPRGPGGFPLPLASGHIAGLSLTTGYTDFNVQYTETTDSAAYWYTHHNYPAGFTYHGFVIGSAIGGDSKEIRFSLEHDFSFGNAEFSYSYQRHGVYHSISEEKVHSYTLKLDRELNLTQLFPLKVFSSRLYFSLSYNRADNYLNRPGEDKDYVVSGLGLNFKF